MHHQSRCQAGAIASKALKSGREAPGSHHPHQVFLAWGALPASQSETTQLLQLAWPLGAQEASPLLNRKPVAKVADIC